MSLFPKLVTWVKTLFGQGPRTRQVTRLSSGDGEPVDASGRPINLQTWYLQVQWRGMDMTSSPRRW